MNNDVVAFVLSALFALAILAFFRWHNSPKKKFQRNAEKMVKGRRKIDFDDAMDRVHRD